MQKIKPYEFNALTGEKIPVTQTVNTKNFAALMSDKENAQQEVTYSEAELKEHTNAAYQKGLNEGIEQGKGVKFQQDTDIKQTLDMIKPQLNGVSQSAIHLLEEHKNEIINLALKIASKKAGIELHNNASELIEKTIIDCLELIFSEPEVTIIVNDSLIEDLEQKMSFITTESGYAGIIKYKANPSIKRGDCRIEWSGGGAVLSADEREKRINEIIEQI